MPECAQEEKGRGICWHILDFVDRTPVAWYFSYYTLFCWYFYTGAPTSRVIASLPLCHCERSAAISSYGSLSPGGRELE
jgi:hypothetical protein